MKLLWCWIVSLSIIARYPLYRLGLARRPLFTDHWAEVERVFRQITRMNGRIRVRHHERCPSSHPAIYAANHIKLDDPFYVCHAVQLATNYELHTRFVMRDDFFNGFPWNWLPFSMNEIAEMGGSYNISQQSTSLAQLRPLVDMLLAPDSFVIFPGGGRSMSGMWLQAHLGDEPGSIAFFLAQALRKNPELQAPAVPVGRTFNPVKRVSTLIFGEPQFLAPGARRDAQRAFDDTLMLAISDLVEIHLLHIVCALLYLRCRHNKSPRIDTNVLAHQCRAVLEHIQGCYVDPALPASLDQELPRVLRYLAQRGAVQRSGQAVISDYSYILAVHPYTPRYREQNTVQFHVNQTVHLTGFVRAVDSVVTEE